MRTTFLTLSLVALASGPALAGDPKVRWAGGEHPVDDLPLEMPVEAIRVIEDWVPWAARSEYRMDLDASGRVLLLSPYNASQAADRIGWIERTLAFCDERLPTPTRLVPQGAKVSGLETVPEDPDDVIPEDPEDIGTTGSGGRSLDEALNGWSTEWGMNTRKLDEGTMVMFVLRSPEDYAVVLRELEDRHPYLAAWAEEAGTNSGFVLEAPLAAAYVGNVPDQQEFDPTNELVHRIAELALLRRFGRLPYWAQQGWAWQAEIELRGTVYVFPYRDEFVWATEHTSWPTDLKGQFAKRSKQPVEMEEIAALARGSWSSDAARVAWGAVRYLDRSEDADLPALLEGLRVAWIDGNRVDEGDGNWSLDPTYRIPHDVQAKIFERYAGKRVFREMTAAFRTGE